MSEPVGGSGARGFVRGPQSFVAGLGLIGLALFAIWAGDDLARGTLGFSTDFRCLTQRLAPGLRRLA